MGVNELVIEPLKSPFTGYSVSMGNLSFFRQMIGRLFDTVIVVSTDKEW